MGSRTEQPSNFNNALCVVYGSSLGLIALMGRNPTLRAVAALAGAGLLLCSAASGKARRATSRVRARHVDEALEDTFPASDPPTWRSPDVPPSNAEAKWQAYREAMDDTDGV